MKEQKQPIIQRIMRKKRKKLLLNLLKKDWKILEVGCGDGWLTDYLVSEGYNCIGIDEDLSKNNSQNCYYADATNLPNKFKDKFDCIISINTLEHVNCDNEIKNVLKKNGLLLVEVPACPDFIWKILDFFGLIHDGAYTHIRFVIFEKLPFRLIMKRRFWVLDKFGIFVNY